MNVRTMEEDALRTLQRAIDVELANRAQVKAVAGFVESVRSTCVFMDRLIDIVEKNPRHLKIVRESDFFEHLEALEREIEDIDMRLHG